jgi:hypothetical protein
VTHEDRGPDICGGRAKITLRQGARVVKFALLKKSPMGLAPNPWARVGWVAGIALGVPLVVLILGASLVWAFSGFAATRS